MLYFASRLSCYSPAVIDVSRTFRLLFDALARMRSRIFHVVFTAVSISLGSGPLTLLVHQSHGYFHQPQKLDLAERITKRL